MKKTILRGLAIALAFAAATQTVYRAVAEEVHAEMSIDENEQAILNFVETQRLSRDGYYEMKPLTENEKANFTKLLKDYLKKLPTERKANRANRSENPGI